MINLTNSFIKHVLPLVSDVMCIEYANKPLCIFVMLVYSCAVNKIVIDYN